MKTRNIIFIGIIVVIVLVIIWSLTLLLVRPMKLVGTFKVIAGGTWSEYRVFETVRGKRYVISFASPDVPKGRRIRIIAEPASEVWYIPFGPEPDGFIRILEWNPFLLIRDFPLLIK